MTGVLLKKENLGTDMQTGRKLNGQEAELRAMPSSQGLSKIPENHQKLGERQGILPQHFKEAVPGDNSTSNC